MIQKVQYNDSAPLNPGQEYEYLVTYETTVETPDGQVTPVTDRQTIPFKVMDAEKRLSIQAELEALERQNSTMISDKLILQKAHYFAEQGLWSDVIQEIFSVKTPSSELSDVIDKIRNQNSCEIKN
ncbi:MAG: hypothetical protein LDL41_10350 [Coleofasciculus sp. S288]|nr:hypothetical protein [Coleofasciculus sp. S288]